MKLSVAEENHLKGIFKLSGKDALNVSTNDLANHLNTSAASVTDMIKRLSEKELVVYEKYKGVTLSPTGKNEALALLRKHRLWEVFLTEKLQFTWDEVHEIAEQLEHIRSPQLTSRLDDFLGNPKFDPHGDPIPDREGNMVYRNQITLSGMAIGEAGVVVGVKDTDPAFLRYLNNLGIALGTKVVVLDHIEYDQSIQVNIGADSHLTVSSQVGQNLFIEVKG